MTVNVSFKIRDWEKEEEMARRIGRMAGKPSVGAGFCFATKERDMDYAFRDRTKAKAFVRSVRRLKGVRAELCD